LNLDDLISKAKRPIGLKDAHSTRETANYKPDTTNNPRVRGFIPAAGLHALLAESPTEDLDFVPSIPKDGPIVSSYAQDGVAGSMADLTGVRVTKPSPNRAVKRQETPVETVEADESLGSLLSQLDGKKE
jgi:hypothetical protein